MGRMLLGIVLEAETPRRPVLMVFEDTHWIDVEPEPVRRVLAGFRRMPGIKIRGPGAMMRLEPQPGIPFGFGNPEKSP
jgi:hypothetical protein